MLKKKFIKIIEEIGEPKYEVGDKVIVLNDLNGSISLHLQELKYITADNLDYIDKQGIEHTCNCGKSGFHWRYNGFCEENIIKKVN